MKPRLIFLILLTFISTAKTNTSSSIKATQFHCDTNAAPKIIKPMENWEIIATNTGIINTAKVFKGNKLTFTVSAHPKNSKNLITIDKQTGVIHVKAVKKDNFDISVKASNPCGTVSNKFNVIIDEEE